MARYLADIAEAAAPPQERQGGHRRRPGETDRVETDGAPKRGDASLFDSAGFPGMLSFGT